jgi:hypothetical protein
MEDAHAEAVFRFGFFDGFVGSATRRQCSCDGLKGSLCRDLL